jgi:PAS domain S-box-containing protein
MLPLAIFFSFAVSAQGQEKSYGETREVVAAFPQNFPPHCFLDEEGQPAGFVIDVMNQVAQMTNLKIIYRPEATFIDAENSLRNGTADLIPNSGITAEQLLEFDFTVPVETFEVVLFVRESTNDIKSLDDLDGRKVAVLPMNVGQRIVKKREEIIGVTYQEISTALFDLLAGKVDGFIYPKPVTLKLAREARIDDRIKIAGPPLVEIKRAIRLRKGDSLLARLNPALEQFLRSQEYQKIYTKWYGKASPFWTPVKVASFMGIIFCITFFSMFIWRYKSLAQLNIQLKKEARVRKKAEDALTRHRDHLETVVMERTKDLTESQKRFKNLSDASFEGIVFSENGKIIETNKAFSEMFGYPLAEIIGMDSTDLISPDARDNVKKKILSASELPYETNSLRKDGSTFPIEVHARMFSYKGRQVRVSAIRDISDWKQAQKNLATSEKRLNETQRLAHIGNWSLDLKTSSLAWSEEIYRIFEIDEQKFGASYDVFLDAIHPEDRKKVDQAYTESLVNKSSYHIEHRLLMKDGRIKYVHEHGESYFDSDGNPVRSVGTVQDITESKLVKLELQRLNEELEQRVNDRTEKLQIAGSELQETQRALMNIVEDLNEKTSEFEEANIKLQGLDRLKSLFIASMSHELRTPLNSIIGFSTIVLDEWLGPLNDEQKAKLAIVLRTGKHLLTLINDVIDVSKIEAGKMDTSSEDFDIQDLVSEAGDLIKKDIQDKGLSLEIAVHPLNLHTDRRRLLQCLVNLLSNACKYTEQGTITVKTALLKDANQSGGDWLHISVNDTGIGITDKDQLRLFTPFSRIDSPLSPLKVREKGTGLGLYLVKKITEEILKGEVGLESISGKGSSFFMKIPYAKK